jgi:hypothetical protein
MKLITFLLSLLLLVFSLVNCNKTHSVNPNLNIAIWYWNSQIAFEQSDLERLHNIGVNTIYFHVGQFHYDNGNISMIQVIDKWPPINDFKIGIVFNFTPEMIRAFTGLSNEELTSKITSFIKQTITKIESSQIKVSAVQCDFDVPTRELKRYSLLLKEIRATIDSRQLSITTLVDWIQQPDYEQLLKYVDLHFPQLYGLSIPKSINSLSPITSPSLISRELKKLAYSSKPYYIGLPTYGYALVFDQKDKFLSVRTDLDLASFSHNPDLKLIETRFVDKKGNSTINKDDYVGENFYSFLAKANIPVGKIFLKEGDKVVFDRLTASSLIKTLEVLRKESSDNLQGVCLFRYPQTDESMVLSIPEIIAAWQNKLLTPELKLDYKVNSRNQTKEIEISLANISTVESLYQSDSVELTIELKGCQILNIEPKDFQSVETFVDNSPASLRLANKIKLTSSYIARQQRLIVRLELAASTQNSLTIKASIKPSILSQSPVNSTLTLIL